MMLGVTTHLHIYSHARNVARPCNFHVRVHRQVRSLLTDNVARMIMHSTQQRHYVVLGSTIEYKDSVQQRMVALDYAGGTGLDI